MMHEKECPSVFDDQAIPCICNEVRDAFDRGYIKALQDANVSLENLMQLQITSDMQVPDDVLIETTKI